MKTPREEFADAFELFASACALYPPMFDCLDEYETYDEQIEEHYRRADLPL